mgnify:CR=1 FL=1|jgi:hypothetical protein|tara:strand:+ start:2032 stop:3687 length:1656 start_codon:yes stop_codon:yes gene_type:complete
MANYTYTVTVASGNSYGGGTGNVYYLNGARNSTGPGTVNWVNGGTLRFEQSDSSNDNHPLIFSTNTNTSGIISSGVTYYLDGASNQANYINTTTFNAATTRYVEVTPSSETDFYYLCYVHGIGMGGIMDITQNTYGALAWNTGVWGNQPNQNINATGLSATSNLGNVIFNFARGWGGEFWGSTGWGTYLANVNQETTGSSLTSAIGSNSVINEINAGWGAQTWASGSWGNLTDNNGIAVGSQLTSGVGSVIAEGVVNIGWGADTWGENLWGNLAPSVVLPSGSSATATAGQVTAEGVVNSGWGRLAWNEGSWGIAGTVLATGSQMISAIGAVTAEGLIEEGWGRGRWGNRAWGETSSTNLVGIQLTSAIGTPTAITDVDVSVTGQQLNFFNIGTYSVQVDASVSVIQAGETLLNLSLGTFSLEQNTVEQVTGLQLNGSVGQAVGGTKIDVGVTGNNITSSAGQSTVVGTANLDLTGQALSLSLGAAQQATKYDVSGVQLSTSIGTVSVTGTGKVIPSGQVLTGSVGTLKISAWNEINPNVTNVWKEVDLAA